MNIKTMSIVVLIISLGFITACSNNENKGINQKIIEIEAGNGIMINTDEETATATYYNYIVDNTTIQIFSFKAADGTVRTAFNTCNACNPSPDSYFIQIGDEFECQTCKNRFHKDTIGLEKSFGCSPIAILDEDKEVNENTITIKSEFIETYKSKFESINIYTNH